jgi:hypothetical protein
VHLKYSPIIYLKVLPLLPKSSGLRGAPAQMRTDDKPPYSHTDNCLFAPSCKPAHLEQCFGLRICLPIECYFVADRESSCQFYYSLFMYINILAQ